MQAHQVASVTEWLECLQYNPWSMGLNPTSADFFYFFYFFCIVDCLRFYTSILGQCSRYLTIYMYYMHDISVQKILNKISFNVLLRSVVYNISVAPVVQNIVYIIAGRPENMINMLCQDYSKYYVGKMKAKL